MTGGRAAARIKGIRIHPAPAAMLLEVEGEGGLSGWCEVDTGRRATARQLIEGEIAKAAAGASVWNGEPLWETIYSAVRDTGHAGLAALSAFDIALWDLRGKVAGLPAHKLLGGRTRERIAACGQLTADAARVEDAARRAGQLRANGYRAVRVIVSAANIPLNAAADPALAVTGAVRAAVGPAVEIIVNLAGAYIPTRAVEIGRRLQEEFGVRYVEDPVKPELLRELAQVADGLDALVCAGGPGCTRWAARDVIDNGRADVIAPELGTSGGITEVKKIAALGQSLSKPLMPRAPRGPLMQAAALQLIASVLTAGPALERSDDQPPKFYTGLPQFKDGDVWVPETPGLGVSVDRAALAAERRT